MCLNYLVYQPSGGNLVGIARQTTALQDELSALKLEEALGSELLKSLEDPRGSAKDKLLIQVSYRFHITTENL